MNSRIAKTLATIGGLLTLGLPSMAVAAVGSACKADAGWNDPAEPLHIYGNTWYVGTCAISAVLVSSKQGHILIDGATAAAAPSMAANIRKLGFRIEDIRYILNSHAHLDHAGGIAALQKWSGAVVVGRAADAMALERGRGDRSDPQFDSADSFTSIPTVQRVADGEVIRVGTLALTAHATPGHTPGSTSWTWRSCERTRCLTIVYADSLTAISDDTFQFSNDQQHPGYLAAFRASIEKIAALPCDILLTPHPNLSQMWAKLQANGRKQLLDPGACRRYAEFARRALDARVAQERRP